MAEFTKSPETAFAEALEAYMVRHAELLMSDFHRRTRKITSPIERMLLAGLYFASGVNIVEQAWVVDPATFSAWGGKVPDRYLLDITENRYLIVPQCEVGKYRLDFGLFFFSGDDCLKLAIECDGHDFHEKTKQQAAHDKRRDRAIAAAGYTMLRFTGSEIYKSVEDCVSEITSICDDWIMRKYTTEVGE